MEEAEWIAAFTRTATALYPNDPETVRIVVEMGRARFAPVIEASAAARVIDHEKTLHNERVKLNATFYNSLAVWFAGAGAAGALINTLIASGSHDFLNAGETGAAGIIIAIVLKWLANREIGKLR